MKNKNIGSKKRYRILYVCLGNICRSPAAQGITERIIAERRLEDIEADSAGILGYHAGELPDRRMRIHARRRGLELTHHSRKVTVDDFDRFDLIVAMDDSNYDDLRELAPSPETAAKVVRISNFFRQFTAWDHVPDPYYGGDQGFENVLDLLDDACTAIVDHAAARVDSSDKQLTK